MPACRPWTLLPAARKGLRLRSGEQNLHTKRRRKSPYRRRAGRGLCSPPPAKAYGSVSGSKIFTEGGGGNRLIAGVPAAAFAPATRKALRLRSGEQSLHTKRRRKTPCCRRAGRGLCSPPPAKAYGFVLGSKVFTQSGGGNRVNAGVPATDFAPRRPQSLTVSSRGAKSSHKAAAENALTPACRPRTLLPAARKGLWLRFGEQKVHRGRRRKTPCCRRAGRGLCSPPPAKAYGFVPGSKIFTQSGGNPIPPALVSAAAQNEKGY